MTDHAAEVASHGEIRICESRCTTCIFKPGNLMHLSPGRLAAMTREALECEGHIVCHSTLDHSRAAICRGYADLPQAQQRSLALRYGAALNILTFITPQPTQDAPVNSADDTSPPHFAEQ